MRDFGCFDSIYDFGCGLGFYMNIIQQRLGCKDTKMHGYDISETACKKAKQNFPSYSFETLDLMLDNAVFERERE